MGDVTKQESTAHVQKRGGWRLRSGVKAEVIRERYEGRGEVRCRIKEEKIKPNNKAKFGSRTDEVGS